MSKYIRTKDGHIVDTSIYKTVVERTFNGKVVAIDLNHWGQDNDKSITWIDVENIIKQADNIEELCDEFVYEYKNSFYKNSKPSYELVKMSLEDMKTTMNSFSGATFYGAIWTEWGLKYVAKMNEKGELVLII